MKKSCIAAAIILNFFAISTAFAQFNMNTVSVNIGTIRTLFPDYSESEYEDYQRAFYPELQIGGGFFHRAVQWALYWGYWSDGLDKPFDWADYVSYSYSSHIVGLRFNVLPAYFLIQEPLPLGVFAGIGQHFINVEWLGGYNFAGEGGKDFTENSATLEIGVNGEIMLLDPIGIRVEAQQFIPFASDGLDQFQKKRRVYKIGVVYKF